MINNYQLVYNKLLLTKKLVKNNHLSIIIYNYILSTINYYKLPSSISQKKR
jgi:hypothetical protein